MKPLHIGLRVPDLICDILGGILDLAGFPPVLLIAVLIGVVVWLSYRAHPASGAEAVR